MQGVNKLKVFYHGIQVGTLAAYEKYRTVFAYEKNWLADGFAVSPFSLPLKEQVFTAALEPFDGLFGVFADSLPDGWGRLLVDRMLRRQGIEPRALGSLERLAIVGATGMGALTYEPDYHFPFAENNFDLDELAEECRRLLVTDKAEDLDLLFRLGGSSGGARPKILVSLSDGEWLIKFPSSEDAGDIGLEEYDYSLCARACGIRMSETKLFPSRERAGYFGTKRFDRRESGGRTERVHMLSAAALLETSHRVPNLDYLLLGKLTMSLTKNFQEVENLFRLMCFNVFAHNRDDHSKNFSFLYNEQEKNWQLAPAYDLTYSYSLGGEHATTINGNGSNPGLADLLEVGRQFGLGANAARTIALDVRECVQEFLGEKYLRKG